MKGELLAVKREGIAVDNEEKELGVKIIGSSVEDFKAGVAVAISVLGPSTRLSDKSVKELEALVKSCGLKISRAWDTEGYE